MAPVKQRKCDLFSFFFVPFFFFFFLTLGRFVNGIRDASSYPFRSKNHAVGLTIGIFFSVLLFSSFLKNKQKAFLHRVVVRATVQTSEGLKSALQPITLPSVQKPRSLWVL